MSSSGDQQDDGWALAPHTSSYPQKPGICCPACPCACQSSGRCLLRFSKLQVTAVKGQLVYRGPREGEGDSLVGRPGNLNRDRQTQLAYTAMYFVTYFCVLFSSALEGNLGSEEGDCVLESGAIPFSWQGWQSAA